jgi:hypothetical protein
MKKSIPYDGSKPMYLVDCEDCEILRSIVLDTCYGLKK